METFGRNELQSPAPEILRSAKTVDILHPALEIPFLSFCAYLNSRSTRSDSDIPEYGVDRQLVLDACRVLTNDAANGFLAFDDIDKTSVPTHIILLAPGRYFYCLPATKYPIVTTFAAWTFPRTIPGHWSRARSNEGREELEMRFGGISSTAMSEKVKLDDDEACIITKYSGVGACENAHLVLKDQVDWFTANDMYRFDLSTNPYSTGVNDVANGITLRSDVHRCLDAHQFVFYPTVDGKFVTYVVGRQRAYAELLHQRLVTIPLRVSVEFLYARFAYTVINLSRSPRFARWAIPISVEVKESQETRLSFQKGKKEKGTGKQRTGLDRIGEEGVDIEMDETSADAQDSEAKDKSAAQTSNSTDECEPQSIDQDWTAADQRWKEKFIQWFPELGEEVNNPPDTLRTGCHTDTLRILRLRSEYMQKHPQVWQTSTTPAGSTRSDVEGDCAKLIARNALRPTPT